jgi:hypothetical protein
MGRIGSKRGGIMEEHTSFPVTLFVQKDLYCGMTTLNLRTQIEECKFSEKEVAIYTLQSIKKIKITHELV